MQNLLHGCVRFHEVGIPGIFRAPGGTMPTVKTICHKFSSSGRQRRRGVAVPRRDAGRIPSRDSGKSPSAVNRFHFLSLHSHCLSVMQTAARAALCNFFLFSLGIPPSFFSGALTIFVIISVNCTYVARMRGSSSRLSVWMKPDCIQLARCLSRVGNENAPTRRAEDNES